MQLSFSAAVAAPHPMCGTPPPPSYEAPPTPLPKLVRSPPPNLPSLRKYRLLLPAAPRPLLLMVIKCGIVAVVVSATTSGGSSVGAARGPAHTHTLQTNWHRHARCAFGVGGWEGEWLIQLPSIRDRQSCTYTQGTLLGVGG